jgi:hypothetical protein
MLLLVMGVAALGYNLGVANGLAQAGGVAAAAPVVAPHFFFFGAPLFFGLFGFLFFALFLRLLFFGFLARFAFGSFGRGPRGRWGGRGGWRDFDEQDPRFRFEEWHRRAHQSRASDEVM